MVETRRLSPSFWRRLSVCGGSRRQGPTGANILTIGAAGATGSLIGGAAARPLGSERVAMWAMVVSGDVRRIVEVAAVARGDREAPACVRGLGPCDDMAPASRSGLRVGLGQSRRSRPSAVSMALAPAQGAASRLLEERMGR